jgi:hypothetical protein
MRIFHWPLALLAALLVLLAAPSARADGIFVTFSGHVTTPRTAAAAFDSTTSIPSNGSSASRPVSSLHLEIDDWSTAAALLRATSENEVFDLLLELTAPNVAGVETTYLSMRYTNATIHDETATYSANGNSASVTQALDILFQKVATSTPPPAQGTAAHSIPVRLTRQMIGKPALSPDLQVSDATIQSRTVANGAVAHLTSLSFSVTSPRDAATGQASGRVQRSPITVVKAPVPSYAGFVGRLLGETRVDFVQHRLGRADVTLYSLVVANAELTSESLEASGGAPTEKIVYTGNSFEFQNATAPTLAKYSIH